MNRRQWLARTGAASALLAAGQVRAQSAAWPYPTVEGNVPLVIAHRGASADRPEHTLAAYERAIELGADYIEPDLVITRDGVLVARHENELSLTTDVASRAAFAGRKRTQTVEGRETSGWFVEDFTLDELRQLRATERFAFRRASAAYNGHFGIPTLGEIIALVRAREAATGRRIGLYPETKHAAHFARLQLPLERALVRDLEQAGYKAEAEPVFIQSFEPRSLKQLTQITALRTVQLVAERGAPPGLAERGDTRTYADLVSPSGLLEVSTYADGIGVAKNLIIPRDAEGRLQKATDLVDRAHAAGLLVHAWTFRNEDSFLPTELKGKPQDELQRFLEAGIDGVFADDPAAAIAAVRRLRRS